jgi:diguanylate cyclase (GGDEF)-like protein/PAS domain S-box-containing protein
MSKEIEPRTTYERSAFLFMALVNAISLLVITGWLFNLPMLTSLRPEFIPMAPSTALIFLGLGSTGLIYRFTSARRGMRILLHAGLLGMLVIVFILAFRSFAGLGPDLEQMLFPNPTMLGEIQTAHISPLTAVGFFLAIPAFFLLTGREPDLRTKNASAALSLAVLLLSGLIILGYLYGVPLFYGGTFIPVAVTTALSFLFLSLGLLMGAGPACWPVRMFVGPSLKAGLMRDILPASIVIVLLQGLFSTASAAWIVNPALRVALAALAACLVFILIISRIAQNLSAKIARADQARKFAENTLIQSETRFRSLVETASDAIINIDQAGQVVFWNRAAETIFGYSAEEVIGKQLDRIMPEKLQAAHHQGLLRAVLTGESHIIGKTVELTGLRKDGREFPLALSLATWQIGEDVFFTGIGRDISEQRLVENALIEERNLLVTLMDNVPDMIYFKDTQSRFIRANQAQARRFGLNDPAQMVGKTDFDLFGEEHAQSAYEDEQAIIRSGQPLVAKEEKEVFLDGHTLWVSTTKMPLRTQQGQIVGTFGISRDITERKLSDEALRESEERLRSLYENVPTGIYRTSQDGQILMANPALVRMLGYETFEELSQRNLAADYYEPEYPRQEFQKRIERDGEVRGLESAWKRKDGSLLYVQESAYLVQNEDHQPFYYEGTVEDISERIRVEEALRKSESSLQAILHSTADGILAVGNENEVLYVNDRFAEIWRIPQAVIASKEDAILLQYVLDQLSDPPSFLHKVQELYKTRLESFDTLNFKDGRVFERLSRPLMEGEVVLGRVWSFRDITERMRLEEEIRNLSLTDELTGLYNRRGFTLLAEQEVKLAHREKRPLLLIFCDVDNLKMINDNWGHAYGDLALKEVSAILKESLRESDILGRIGGDEFVALALAVSKESAEIITNRIQSALELRNQEGDKSYQLAFSLGIACYDFEAPSTLDELIAKADGLMYLQKQSRKMKK